MRVLVCMMATAKIAGGTTKQTELLTKNTNTDNDNDDTKLSECLGSEYIGCATKKALKPAPIMMYPQTWPPPCLRDVNAGLRLFEVNGCAQTELLTKNTNNDNDDTKLSDGGLGSEYIGCATKALKPAPIMMYPQT